MTMPLPILQMRPEPADLMRLFEKTDRRWVEHLGEAEEIGCGVAIANPELPLVFDANQVRDAELHEGRNAAEAVAEVEEYFAGKGTKCAYWVMNVSSPEERVKPLVQHLRRLGWREAKAEVMYLRGMPRGKVVEAGGLTVIPTRASYRHAQELAQQAAAHWGGGQAVGQLAEAALRHLDDPHVDAVLALKEGQAAGMLCVQSVGELGLIEGVFVAEKFRGQGVGRTLMSRAMEVCARSLFKHVFVAVSPEEEPALALYRRMGFEKIGEAVSYRRPQ